MLRPRIWFARLVLLAAASAVLYGAFDALVESRRTFRYARRHAQEPFEAAQDRLFGREHMNSVRAARAQFAEADTVYFVDDPSRRDGATYFVLHQLAPRRLERFCTVDDLAEKRFPFWLPLRVRWAVVVSSAREPIRLSPGRALRVRVRGGAARARPARP